MSSTDPGASKPDAHAADLDVTDLDESDIPTGPLDGPAPAAAVVAYAAGDAAYLPAPDAPRAALPASPARARASLLALSAMAFLVVTNEIAPLGLIDGIAEDIGRSRSEVGFLTTAFAVTVMLASVPLARFTTSWRRKPVVMTALAVWLAGTVLTFSSEAFSMILAGRGLTGLGHALFWAVATPAVAGMFPPEIRGRCVSRLLLGASGAGIVGLPGTTWLAESTSWRVPLMVIAGLGTLVAIAIFVVMPSFRSSEGTAERGQYPSRSRYLRVLAVTLLAVASTATTFTFVRPFMMDVADFSAGTIPVLLAAGGAVGMVAMWLVGRYLDRFPVRSVAVGLLLLAGVWLVLFLAGMVQVVAVGMLMAHGFAWSVLVASMINWAIRHTPWATDIGVALYNSTFNAGNAAGSVLGAGILEWCGARWLPGASMVLVLVAGMLVWQVRPLGLTARSVARSGLKSVRH